MAAWITIVVVIIFLFNIWAVGIYGEVEFIFSSFKVITIVGLILLALIIDLGGVSGQKRLGFHYWRDPGAMNQYIASGAEGRFLAWFSTLVNAAFSYSGVELVAVAAVSACLELPTSTPSFANLSLQRVKPKIHEETFQKLFAESSGEFSSFTSLDRLQSVSKN